VAASSHALSGTTWSFVTSHSLPRLRVLASPARLPDGKHVVAGLDSGALAVVDTGAAHERAVAMAVPEAALAVNPKALTAADAPARKWQRKRAIDLRVPPARFSPAPHGTAVTVSTADGLFVIDAKGSKVRLSTSVDPVSGNPLAWSPAGERIAFLEPGGLRVVAVKGGEPKPIAGDVTTSHVAWGRRGIATGGAKHRTIQVWDPATGKPGRARSTQ
jgi:hypothetical protein